MAEKLCELKKKGGGGIKFSSFEYGYFPLNSTHTYNCKKGDVIVWMGLVGSSTHFPTVTNTTLVGSVTSIPHYGGGSAQPTCCATYIVNSDGNVTVTVGSSAGSQGAIAVNKQ